MSDYISRETALARIKDLPTWWADAGGYYGHAMNLPDGLFDPEDVISTLKNIPAADVVPVVRCKDCRHFNFDQMECENELVITDHEGGASYSLNFCPADFCSYGERKDDTMEKVVEDG